MQALPDIDYQEDPNEPSPALDQERDRKGGLGWVAVATGTVGLLALIAAGAGAVWWLRNDMVSSVNEVREQQQSTAQDVAALRSARASDSETSAAYRQQIEETQKQLAVLRGDNAQAMELLGRLEGRVTDLAKAFERREEERKAVAKAPHVPRPKPAKASPPPAKVQPAELVSISSFGGMASVTLKVGTDVSDLMMPGDRFRDWEFVSADPRARMAVFEVAGQTRELRL